MPIQADPIEVKPQTNFYTTAEEMEKYGEMLDRPYVLRDDKADPRIPGTREKTIARLLQIKVQDYEDRGQLPQVLVTCLKRDALNHLVGNFPGLLFEVADLHPRYLDEGLEYAYQAECFINMYEAVPGVDHRKTKVSYGGFLMLAKDFKEQFQPWFK